jgi:hypothetical protein|tara:strand:- start:228 stop:551 length:324 start_codon:yes stop_codon:yes gene_type:complete
MNEVYQSEDPSEHNHDAQKDLEMIHQQLSNVQANVEALLQQCSHNSPKLSEAWVQSKVTLANDYLDTVHSYVVNGGDAKPDAGQKDSGNVGFVIAVEKAMTDGSSKT